MCILRSRERRYIVRLPRVWDQPPRRRGQRRTRRAKAGGGMSCVWRAGRLQDRHRTEGFVQLDRLLPRRFHRRDLPQRQSSAESSVQRVWRIFWHPHGALQGIASDSVASHCSDTYCASLCSVRWLVFKVSSFMDRRFGCVEVLSRGKEMIAVDCGISYRVGRTVRPNYC